MERRKLITPPSPELDAAFKALLDDPSVQRRIERRPLSPPKPQVKQPVHDNASDLQKLREGLADAEKRYHHIEYPLRAELVLLYCTALGRAYDAAWRIYERMDKPHDGDQKDLKNNL